MAFWVIVIVAVGASFLLESDIGKIVLTAVVAAFAFLLVNLITGWEIMVTLAKVCGAGAILIAAFIIISSFFGSGN